MFKWLSKKYHSVEKAMTIEDPFKATVLPNKKVLIVDRDQLSRDLYRALLEPHSYDTFEISDRSKLIELAHEFSPDLILVDINSVDDLEKDIGLGVKQDDALVNIPIIVISSYCNKHELDEIQRSGCYAVIQKPIKVNLFLETINDTLARKPFFWNTFQFHPLIDR